MGAPVGAQENACAGRARQQCGVVIGIDDQCRHREQIGQPFLDRLPLLAPVRRFQQTFVQGTGKCRSRTGHGQGEAEDHGPFLDQLPAFTAIRTSVDPAAQVVIGADIQGPGFGSIHRHRGNPTVVQALSLPGLSSVQTLEQTLALGTGVKSLGCLGIQSQDFDLTPRQPPVAGLPGSPAVACPEHPSAESARIGDGRLARIDQQGLDSLTGQPVQSGGPGGAPVGTPEDRPTGGGKVENARIRRSDSQSLDRTPEQPPGAGVPAPASVTAGKQASSSGSQVEPAGIFRIDCQTGDIGAEWTPGRRWPGRRRELPESCRQENERGSQNDRRKHVPIGRIHFQPGLAPMVPGIPYSPWGALYNIPMARLGGVCVSAETP